MKEIIGGKGGPHEEKPETDNENHDIMEEDHQTLDNHVNQYFRDIKQFTTTRSTEVADEDIDGTKNGNGITDVTFGDVDLDINLNIDRAISETFAHLSSQHVMDKADGTKSGDPLRNITAENVSITPSTNLPQKVVRPVNLNKHNEHYTKLSASSDSKKVCKFCGKTFQQTGSLGRHLDHQKGNELHPAEEVEKIRGNVARRGNPEEIPHLSNSNTIQSHISKLTIGFENWQTLSAESKKDMWNREQRVVLQQLLGELTVFDFAIRDKWAEHLIKEKLEINSSIQTSPEGLGCSQPKFDKEDTQFIDDSETGNEKPRKQAKNSESQPVVSMIDRMAHMDEIEDMDMDLHHFMPIGGDDSDGSLQNNGEKENEEDGIQNDDDSDIDNNKIGESMTKSHQVAATASSGKIK
ncbi:hypothetical protein BOH78_0995 [Pichia kudriavzevii]|uniref:C2H2-type domain-containing protein n=1 Tax=Pichia kudriavzevii TaxID=4909 RepID=A0A099NYJ2_PICKU|nr:hypothetical protein JL09_g3874 [Pichia kudriavzevii]ONH76635.1 hypothetical protein BOH78_0995 [Pichia kudriavzevii]